ncbi:MAG TPA: hypothetical protein ENN69_00180, partial [Spirochaetia bacterium]|nr:hypothetical protein [Spirochaetia bacterium]
MRIPRILSLSLLFILTVTTLSAQESQAPAGANGARVEPVFPEANTNLIFVEGEDTAATNFSKEPIVNYGCSGKRTLQLSRTTGLQDGAPFYADFLFYAETSGTYELWYGGTPSGPRDELAESYSSPFSYQLDEGRTRTAYREEIAVVENYAPSYYWNLVGDVAVSAGEHKIRFQVQDRRRYDGRYYFYLDCFFLIKKEGQRRLPVTAPPVFPRNMADRSINRPFKAIDDYLILIRDRPQDVKALVELSMIYSLLSDYLSALKYLKRAEILQPDNLDIKLLIAKNYIWKGEVENGLEKYQELLDEAPERLDVWLEIGKVAAWTGRYQDSLQYYRDALRYHPGNIEIKVNMAITHLWNSDELAANALLAESFEEEKGSLAALKKMADALEVAGYPQKAIEIYRQAQALFPTFVEPFILETELLRKIGRNEEADRVDERIRAHFVESAQLNRFLEIEKKKQTLKDWLVEEYRKRLAASPDNLELRELLAQVLFWQGKRRQAIGEYLNILTNHAYSYIKNMDANSIGLYELLDKTAVAAALFDNLGRLTAERKLSIRNQYQRYENVRKDAARVETETAAVNARIAELEKEAAAATDEKTAQAAEKKLAEVRENLAALTKKRTELAAAIKVERETLEKLLREGYKFIEQIGEAQTVLETVAPKVVQIGATETDERARFNEEIEQTGWALDRNEFINELIASRENGLFLASHILARIRASERKFGEARSLIEERVTAPDSDVPVETRYLYLQTLLWDGKTADADAYLATQGAGLNKFAFYIPALKELIQKIFGEGIFYKNLSDDFDKEIDLYFAELDKTQAGGAAASARAQGLLDTLFDTVHERIFRTAFRYYLDTALI